MTLLYNKRHYTLSPSRYAPAVRRTGSNAVQRITFGIPAGQHLFTYELRDGEFGPKPGDLFLSNRIYGQRRNVIPTYDNPQTQLFPPCTSRGSYGGGSSIMMGAGIPWSAFPDARSQSSQVGLVSDFVPQVTPGSNPSIFDWRRFGKMGWPANPYRTGNFA